MIVGEADLDVHARTEHVDDDLRRDLNVIAARAGDRFGTLLGKAIGAPLGLFARRAGVNAGDNINSVAARVGDRFGTTVGRGLAAPFRRAATNAGRDAGRSAGSAFSGAFRGVLSGAAIIGLFRSIRSQVSAGFAEFSAGETGRAQLEAGLKSTNAVAGVTVERMEQLAGSLQRLTGVDDDLVVHAEGVLLTFSNVRDVVGEGNDVFTQAITLARDLSVRGFGDLNATSLQLGKALNDPIRGVGALSRAGIQFTAGQRRLIQQAIEQNRVLDAQKIILTEVTKQVGGSAIAYGKTFPGALATTRERFANLRGEFIGRFIPALLGAFGATNTVLDKIEAHPEVMDRIVTRVVTIARNFIFGIRDLFSNFADGLHSARDEIDKLSRVAGLLGQSTGSGSLLQTSLGGVGTLLGGLVVITTKVAVAYLEMGVHIAEATSNVLFTLSAFVRGVDTGMSRVAQGAEVVATALGGPLIGEAVHALRAKFDSGLGDVADDIDHFAGVIAIGGAKLGAALAGGIGQGLLAQANTDPALKSALDTILGAPVGVGISPSELNKYADGVTLRESFFAGLTTPTGTAPDGSGLIDTFDKDLAAAQKAAGDRARAIGNTVTQGIRDHLNIVKREVSALTSQRNKILDFRSSVLSAAGSFTKLSDLIDDPSQSTAARIEKALSNRLLGLQTFARNLQTLSRRGLDKGVIAELALGGPEQRALSSALVAGTDAQIKQLNATERAVRQQQQVVAAVATDAQFGPHALDKANKELARLNAQVAALNKQIQAQPALIAKAVDQARKNATVSTKTNTKTAVAK